MSDRDEYYRQQAAEAERQAGKSNFENDKATWLSIAQSWMAMIRPRRHPTIETFDEKAKRLGTGQDIAKEQQ